MEVDEGQRRAVGRIRRIIEGVLSPSRTSTVLFEALAAHGDEIPRNDHDVRALVRGPLRSALSNRVGEEQTNSLIEVIESALSEVLDPDAAAPTPIPDEPPTMAALDPDATAAFPLASAPVEVAVVAGGRGFADRLAMALGPRRVAPRAVSGAAQLKSLTPEPAIVIVDGTDFTAIEPDVWARLFTQLPPTTVVVVWAAGLPYGRTTVEALTIASVDAIALKRTEGIEPLLDLIRSRRV
ncbi:MAG: hypothetical protein AAGF12_30800 [Myxococcota bacterium]